MTRRSGHLFEGYGGLSMAADRFFGTTPAWHSEIEPAAVRLLEHHYPGRPNLGDITAVEWADVEPVWLLTGGFPCQDVSSAGKRAGLRPDSRSGLWTHMARAIAVLRPQVVLIENVRGLLSAEAASELEPCPWCLGDERERPLRALGAVLGDLAVLGYDARWVGVRAADADAPHERFRVFVWARSCDSDGVDSEGWAPAGLEGEAGPAAGPAPDPGSVEPERRRVGGVVDGAPGSGVGEGPKRQRDRDTAGDGGSTPADAAHVGHERGGSARHGWSGPADGGDRASADTDCAGREGPQPARRHDLPARGATSDAQGVGRREGRPEPAGVVGGPNAAVSGGEPSCPTCGHPEHHHDHGGTCASCPGGECPDPELGRPAVADPDGDGLAGGSQRDERAEAGQPAPLGGDAAGRVLDWAGYEPAIRRWEQRLGRPAPTPTQTGSRGGQQLSPRFVEWLMGLPEGWVTGVPGLSRNQQLKLLGNGVVPQQAALALALLSTPAAQGVAA